MWLNHLISVPKMSIGHILVLFITWPYHRSFRYFTLEPCTKLAEDYEKKDPSELPMAINHWCLSKKQEYDFVTNASSLAAIANLSIFSWSDIVGTYWVAYALFYFSLSLSLWAVILSAQQKSVTRTLAVYQDTPAEQRLKVQIILRFPAGREHLDRNRTFAELNMLYVWQCPLMLMSYGWATLVLGITLHVCAPLINYNGDEKRKVAIFYIVTAAVLFINFAWSSAWSFWRPRMSEDEEKAFRNHSIASLPMPSSPRETRDSIQGFEFETPFTRTETQTLGTAGWNTAPTSPRGTRFPREKGRGGGGGWTMPASPASPASPTGTANSAFEFTTPSTRTGTTVVAAGPEEKEKVQLDALVGPR